MRESRWITLHRKAAKRASVNTRKWQFQELEPRLTLAAQPIISEFLASNDDGLLDDNGNSSDWIEIYNAGDASVDLAGYTLTDDPSDVDKWAFPSVILAPKQHLVVFAGTDTAPGTGADLYTGFGLSSAGEYVGLYNPTGGLESEFDAGGTEYPPQFEDLSYGLRSTSSISTALSVGANSQYHVPDATTGPALGDAWRQPDYALGSSGEVWQSGPSGFGYENFSGYEPFIETDVGGEMFLQTASLYLRSTFVQEVGNPFETLALNARYEDGFVAYLNGVEILRENGPTADIVNLGSIPLDNLFDDPKGTPLADAIASDAYQAEGDSSDLGVHTVIDGGLNLPQAIAPGVTFNLASAGGGNNTVGGRPSNDTFRSTSTGAIRTLGLSVVPDEKVEDGIGMHADELITFDINELRTAGGFVGDAAYFTARSGVNDSAGSPGSVKTIVLLSDDSGQVLAGYVNGQQVEVTNSGGVWSFTGAQPDILERSGDNRIAPIAVAIHPQAAYLTLAGTSNGSANSDHAVFSKARLEFQSIALGNLFDDVKGTALDAALASDTLQARGDLGDLGIAAVVDGGFLTPKTIAPGILFDLSNVGDSAGGDGDGPSNDTLSSGNDQPLSTRNISFAGAVGSLAEDGVGLAADELVTFDIEELRAAGGLSTELEFRFKARAGINDNAPESASGLAIVLASDASGNVVGAWVNGQATSVSQQGGEWSLDFPAGPPSELTASDAAVDLDLALPSNTAYVTLIGAGGATTTAADHVIFSGARLNAVPDADGLSWDSIASATRSDTLAIEPRTFDLSSHLGLLRDGNNVLAVQALNRAANSSDFLFSHEIITGDFAYEQDSQRFFTEPTPGRFNGEGVAGVVENVTYSVERGFYNDPISVALTTATIGAQVYFTTDGSLPGPDNPAATAYTTPVAVSTTTTLRAAAYATDFAPSYIDTKTYVFVEDVLVQDPRNDYGNGVSPNNGLVYPVDWDSGVTGDYGIDPDVVAQWDDNNPANTDIGIRESLLSIPSFSLTLDHGDAFRPLSDDFPGILTNARNRGEGFRHAGSIEYFDPATGEHFQANAAVQAQGNSSRSSGSTRQHSYRLIFNETLGGPGRLNFPLFDNSDFADINTFTLKVASTDGFSHDSRTNGSTINPLNSTYTRDAYIRQLHFNTGNPAADSTFAHVYINGLYWGLYIPIERPDDAFFSSRFGGEREDWDVYRDNDEFISGNSTAWNQMRGLISTIGSASSGQADDLFQQLQGKNSDGTNNPSVEALMDVDNFIDYMAIHMSSNTNDWPHRNWYVARNRVDPGKGFKFFAWDQGQSLAQDFIDRTERQGGLGTLHRQLRNSPEYRLRFADRIQEHFFNDGALTLSAKQQTWTALADQTEAAIIAESARWGDSREGEFSNAFGTSNPPSGAPLHPLYPPGFATTVPTLTIDNWRTNIDFVHDEVLPFGRGVFFDRMADDGLWFDSVAAPTLSLNGTPQHGGAASAGDSVSLAGSGTIYFTLDGTDPRLPGGVVAGDAYTGPVTLDTTTVVSARSFSGGEWSPLSEATFSLANGSLVISEINYNPSDPTASELIAGFDDNDDFEFVEIVNTSNDPINLGGISLAGAVDFTFGNTVLASGQRVIVVEDQGAFEERYGTGIEVLGQWSGGLSNGGETLRLLDSLDNEIQSVAYNDGDPWSVAADGNGATLVLDDPANTPAERLGKAYSWRHSAEFGGSPGQAGTPLAGVVVNEVLAHTDLPQTDAVELYNPTDQAIDLGGWFLSDDGVTPLKYEIPADTILGPRQYLVFDEDDFAVGEGAFRLDAGGDQVYVVDPTGGTLRFADVVDFGGTLNGESLGRTSDGAGRLAPMRSTTLGAANSLVRVGPLVISEVNYHPSDPTAFAQAAFAALDSSGVMLTDNDLEFVEVHNPTNAPISLDNWRLRGESDFNFAASTSLDAGETLVVVSFDPTTDAARLAGFRTHYGIGTGIKVVGGFDQNLSNGEARVTLQQPDAGMLNPSEIAFVISDEVLYDDLAPWPNSADGSGAALERVGPTLDGNAASSWLASLPTPGVVEFSPALLGDYDRNGVVELNDRAVWASSYGSSVASSADGNNDGVVDAADYTIWRDNLGASLPATATQAFFASPAAGALEPAASALPGIQFAYSPAPRPGGLAVAGRLVAIEAPANDDALLLALAGFADLPEADETNEAVVEDEESRPDKGGQAREEAFGLL